MQAQNQIIHLKGKEEFKKVVIDSNIPTIVDFFATWCSPCQKLGQYLEEKIKTIKGYQIVKIDSGESENDEICEEHQIKSIPAVFLYYNKARQDTFVGFNMDKLNQFMQKCEEEVAKAAK